MFNLNKITRQNIRSLQPYSSARDEFNGSEGIFLDANENPFGTLNRYPDPYQNTLKEKISELKNIPKESIFIGNGSDEVIDLVFRIFCEPNVDTALTFSPTYGMYDVSAAINDVELIKIPLTERFQIDYKAIEDYLKLETLKVIFICSPNNPTGNLIATKTIEKILQNFNGIVLIDEAYIDFCDSESWAEKISKFPNLIVSQTLSKAYGLAAARVGMAFANPEIVSLFNKVKPPYNVSLLNQEAAISALNMQAVFLQNLEIIKSEKNKLIKNLKQLSQTVKIYPSDANFLLVEVKDANALYSYLVSEKIITRNRAKLISNCLRITVGIPEENSQLINAIKKFEI